MINFIKKRRLWYSFSIIIIGIGVISMVSNFQQMNHIFNLGIDFTGGTSITLRFNDQLSTLEKQLRETLMDTKLTKHSIQTSGLNDIVIKTEEMTVEKRNELFTTIEKKIGPFDVLEVDIIGPSIGEQLQTTSIIIIIAVSIAILIYCSWRFEFIFGIASIIALLHDAFILLCVSALLQLEINTSYVAALLTMLGYSINDTIVIFDRIREKIRNQEDTTETWSKTLLNTAINEMLPRSIHTSITTGLVLGSIYMVGGLSLKVFSSVLIIGLITGTYSSLFIASPMIITILKIRGAQIGQ